MCPDSGEFCVGRRACSNMERGFYRSYCKCNTDSSDKCILYRCYLYLYGRNRNQPGNH